MSHDEDKTLLITGGTGSFGNAVLKPFSLIQISRRFVFSHAMRRNRTICVTITRQSIRK